MKIRNKNLEKRIEAIEKRNAKVELDKVWEVSWTRRISIALLTYLVICSYLMIINKEKPFINGMVPVFGYLLSTVALRKIRTIWQNKRT